MLYSPNALQISDIVEVKSTQTSLYILTSEQLIVVKSSSLNNKTVQNSNRLAASDDAALIYSSSAMNLDEVWHEIPKSIYSEPEEEAEQAA